MPKGTAPVASETVFQHSVSRKFWILKASDRAAFSPAEFAALFGKSQTWGYRQIYAGKVTTITEYGRILIPAAEVEKILAKAGIYDGEKPKPQKSKQEIQKLAPKLKTAWQDYLHKLRGGKKAGEKRRPAIPGKVSSSGGAAQNALRRFAAARSKGK